MKNIHVIPTDKPSSLYYKDNKYKLADSTTAIDWYISSAGYKPTNIYITSDEEIKEGDWFYLNDAKIVVKYIDLKPVKEAKKIILTTDQELIKDGVQPIDDKFFSWFVKNPNCESVDVDYGFFNASGRKVDPMDILQNHSKCVWKYKIIIPKEEGLDFLGRTTFDLLKQEAIEEEMLEQEALDNIEIEEMSNDWKTMSQQIKPKQETLVKAFSLLVQENPILKNYNLNHLLQVARFGAKWQKEQDKKLYSEEDLEKAFKVGFTLGYGSDVEGIDDKDECFNRWFKIFKDNQDEKNHN
jgi:hypothetical protein